MAQAFLSRGPSVADYVERLSYYEDYGARIAEIPAECHIGPICLSSNALKFALRAELDAWKFQFTSQLLEVSLAEVAQLAVWMDEQGPPLEARVRDIDEVKQMAETLEGVIAREVPPPRLRRS